MGIKNWLKVSKKKISSCLSTDHSSATELAGAQNRQGDQQAANPNVLLNANSSTVDQVNTNETIERSDAPRAQIIRHELDSVSIRELWNVAWKKLREEDKALTVEYEVKLHGSVVAGLSETIGSKSNIRDRMSAILGIKMEEVNRNATKLTLGNSEVKIKDAGEIVLNIVSSANSYITQAVSANPYTSIAWAGVSFLLPLFMNISAQSASLARGLEYISRLISQSQMREEFYVKFYESRRSARPKFQQSHRAYKVALERLYRQILKFQAKCCCYYSNNSAFRHGLDAIKWNDWDLLINEVREQDENFIKVEQIWQYIEQRSTEETAMDEKKREELFSWLCSIDPSSIYNTTRDRHEDGTNEWLVKDNEEFKTWETTAGSLLWLHGKAGSGKSVLSSSVINYLKSKHGLPPVLAYFYFSFSDLEKQKVDVMLTSLIKQICYYRADIPQLVELLREYKTRGERPDNKTLEAALIDSTFGFSDIYIIIDGLDECPPINGEREKLLKSLQHILLNDRLTNHHIFLTSRKEPDIDSKIRALLSPPLRMEIDLLGHQEILNNDISLYISSTLATDNFKSWTVKVKEDTKQSLIRQADGMFQYVQLQLEELQKCSSIAKITKELQRLPIGLNAVYNRIFENIDIKFQAQVINSLKWLAFSNEVLTIEELSEIFIIDLESDVAFDEAERHFDSSDICKHFSGLIIIQQNTTPHNKDRKEVRLVHISIKEYLTSNTIGGTSSVFSFTDVDAHMHIARSCLAYLTYLITVAEKDTRIKDVYPLKSYAAKYWMFHLEKMPFTSWPAKVVPSVVLALTDHSQILLLTLLGQEARTENFSKHMLKRPFCYTAYGGFCQLTEFLFSPDLNLNKYITQEDLDLGLQYAAYRDHLHIVRFFFKKGAKVNAHSRRWNSAVHAAVSGGSVNVLKFFLNSAANINYQPALFMCIPKQDTRCLELLLDHGMNVNLHDEEFGTALHKAIADGNSKNIELLLEKGADTNALSKTLGTPLQAACAAKNIVPDQRLGHIKKMLDCGADPNICGGGYATALQAASCYSGLRFAQDINLARKFVQLLIEHGADANTQGGEWGSALHAAAASAHSEAVEVMKLLLEKGTKVNQQGNSSQGTALQVACNLGTIDAVHFLLDQGADVNAEGGRFGTSLQAAAARSVISHPQSKVQILKLLLNKGANINQQSREFGTALQAVCCSPNVDLIRLLLEYGADVNVEAGRYGTALIAACGNRWTESEHVSLLLDRGANINAQVEKHGTALIAACQRNPECGQQGIMEVVQLLLDRGADVNAQGGKYGTALSAACFWGNSKLIQLLLSHGADIHLRDCAAWHAATCCVAIRYGDASVLELLLDHGMDVNHAHAEYGTALHAMITAKDVGGNWRKGVGVLFEYHINPTITSEQLGSTLHIACAIKHENEHAAFEKWCFSCKNIDGSSAKTKHLLEQYPNINVNVQGGMFGSALQAAAYSGQALSVRLLLDRKARVNARGGKYRSALNGAIISGYWNIVKILLEAGATPDCHLQEQPDEKWLQTVLEEDGRGAVERYRKFWEVESIHVA